MIGKMADVRILQAVVMVVRVVILTMVIMVILMIVEMAKTEINIIMLDSIGCEDNKAHSDDNVNNIDTDVMMVMAARGSNGDG